MAKGKKTGGRTRGTPNKGRAVQRKLLAEAAAKLKASPAVVERPRVASRGVLERFRDLLEGMAGHYGPRPPGEEPNKNENFDRFLACAVLAIKCAAELQQYEEPKLRAIMVGTSDGMGARPAGGEVVELKSKDPVREGRVYRMMIEDKRGAA